MKIAYFITFVIASLVGGFLAHVYINVQMGFFPVTLEQAASNLQFGSFAFGGLAVTALVLFFSFNGESSFLSQLIKLYVCLPLLFFSSASSAYGIWGEARIAELKGNSSLSDWLFQATNPVNEAESLKKLSPDLLSSDKYLGLACLQSLLALKGNSNSIIFAPGIAQILHMDLALADSQTQSEILQAAKLKPLTLDEMKASDKALRDLLTGSDAKTTRWTNSVQIGATSQIIPTETLKDLCFSYCGKGIENRMDLSSRQAVFTASIDFDAKWKYSFEKNATTLGEFHRSEKETLLVNFMHQKFSSASPVYHYQSDIAEVVGLPYKRDKQIAYFILPKEGKVLSDYVSNLTLSDLNELIHRGRPLEGEIALPKFSFSGEDLLNPVLQRMGIRRLLEENCNSLPLLSQTGQTYVQEIRQKSKLSVDEEGTKIAVQVIQISAQCQALHPEPARFKMTLNRPFLFVIEDQLTKELVFLSAVFKP